VLAWDSQPLKPRALQQLRERLGCSKGFEKGKKGTTEGGALFDRSYVAFTDISRSVP
jgi:hypothetical protein